MFALNEIEGIYREAIEGALAAGKSLTPLLLIDLSAELYKTLKVEGILDESDGDMLLFQYGSYDLYDGNGRRFDLNITRQFLLPSIDEPYQLDFSLIYEPAPFESIRPYVCWYPDYGDLDSFVAHVKTTDGFIAAENQAVKTYSIFFSQV